MNLNALDVAEWFLNKNNIMQSITDTEYITNLKLQKLLYYAQGEYLKNTNKTLFDDNILAWEHGPVIKAVYDKYKVNGSKGIEFDGSLLTFDDSIELFLEKVYDDYAQYSAWKLRNMTHCETPWLETERNKEITIDKMKSYFCS